jgi:hypothetical protein
LGWRGQLDVTQALRAALLALGAVEKVSQAR